VLTLSFGIFKFLKLFSLAILSKYNYLKVNLNYVVLQMLGSPFSSFCYGRSVSTSDYGYKLLVQV